MKSDILMNRIIIVNIFNMYSPIKYYPNIYFIIGFLLSASLNTSANAEEIPRFLELTCIVKDRYSNKTEEKKITPPLASYGRFHVNEYHIIDNMDVQQGGLDTMFEIINRKDGTYKFIYDKTIEEPILSKVGKCKDKNGNSHF